MEFHDILAGIGVLVGLAGIVLVFLPGLLLQVASVLFWSAGESSPIGWVTFGVVASVAVAATVLKYLFPQRRLSAAGIPGWLIFVAVIAALVGLFVIPVVGAPVGFVVAIYLFERFRHGPGRAWPSTKTAVQALLMSMGIELAGGFVILIVFVLAVATTLTM